ncbi:hypothetical protein LY76DRAFT_89043 [Colletotrichum caudatum]|nr:hypothetical protein LY76DRAFT_89043 [Colletotrichum caudatum]
MIRYWQQSRGNEMSEANEYEATRVPKDGGKIITGGSTLILGKADDRKEREKNAVERRAKLERRDAQAKGGREAEKKGRGKRKEAREKGQASSTFRFARSASSHPATYLPTYLPSYLTSRYLDRWTGRCEPGPHWKAPTGVGERSGSGPGQEAKNEAGAG